MMEILDLMNSMIDVMITILAAIAASPLAQRCEIIEDNAGTHFLLRLATSRSDAELKRSAAERGLSLRFLSDYRSDGKNSGCAIVNYACMPTERLPAALEKLAGLDSSVPGIVRGCARASANVERRLWAERDAQAEEDMRAWGVEVTTLSEAEMQKFRASVRPIY